MLRIPHRNEETGIQFTTCHHPVLKLLIILQVISYQHGHSATDCRRKDLGMDPSRIVVFSGGSAANNLVDIFGKVAHDKDCSLS